VHECRRIGEGGRSISTLTASVPVPRSDFRFVALVAGLPILLGIAQVLPHNGAGLPVRLAAAAACVLIVPGALILRLTGWPKELGVALAGSLAWSLTATFVCLLLTFAFAGSLTLTLVLLAALSFGTAVPVAIRRSAELDRSDLRLTAGVALAGVAFAVAVWLFAGPVSGDGLFHLGRIRKLLDFTDLSTLSVVDEFKHGGLHPGYAFPLWHGALALVAKLAGVDPTLVLRYLSAILVPLAFVLAYAAGRTLFRSPWGGAAVVLAQLVQLGLPVGRTGAFRALALPATASRQLLVTAILALVFAYVRDRSTALLGALVAGGLSLALIHPTYAAFLAILLGGFLIARALLAQADVPRLGATLVALVVPAAGVAFWLLPVVKKTASYHASGSELHRSLTKYADQLDVFSDHAYRLAPELFVQGGAVAIGALVLVPLAVLAARRRWAAYVLGSSLAVFVLTLVPLVFPRFADAVSISQARRMGIFIPFAFALAGGAAVLARVLGPALVPLALGAGIALQLVFPGGFSYHLDNGGPAIATWIAAFGGAGALVAGTYFGRSEAIECQGAVALGAVALFVVPAAVSGFAHFGDRRSGGEPALTPGVVNALREDVPMRSVVFSDDLTGYRIAAYAPVYVNAAPPSHVADTTDNRPFQRRSDALRFMRTGDLSIPRRYHARWIVVDKDRFRPRLHLPRVYRDARYVVYRLTPG